MPVHLILLVDWDPLGIFGYPSAMNEYDSYANDICALLRSGVSREALIRHLDTVETQTMSGRGGRKAQAEVADKLLMLFKTIADDERRSPHG
jgi:hypothetical protein